MSLRPERNEPGGELQPAPTAERRWPMAAAVLAAVAMQVVAPRHGRLPGWWVVPALEVVMLVVLILRDPGRIDRRSRALRRQTFVLIAIMTQNVATTTATTFTQ